MNSAMGAKGKKMRKAVQTGVFIAVLVASFMLFNRVFCFKRPDGIYQTWAFYRQKRNSVDVVLVGSSHIFINVNIGTLWDEYGMAGFNFCSGDQAMWNSYYFIKEALKTQKPCLVVLDLNGMLHTIDYQYPGRIVYSTFGFRPSQDKIRSIMTSAPKGTRPQYLLGFPMYHTRYTELNDLDFFPSHGSYSGVPHAWNNTVISYDYWKGHGVERMSATNAQMRPLGFETDEAGELTPKVEKYFRMICALCRDKGVPLLLIKTPYVTNINDTKVFNRAAQIAAKYDIPFVNFNYYIDDIGMDYSTHYADGVHMNYKGDRVFSQYLGAYIKARYGIPDRRDEKNYESYGVMAADERERAKRLEEQEKKAAEEARKTLK